MRGLSFFVGLLWLASTSCEDIPDCDDPNSSEVIIQFMDSTNTVPESKTFTRITELETGFVFAEDTTTSVMALEVNPTDSLTGYIFDYSEDSDTLIVGYKQNQLLRSEFCGPVIRYSELSILKHTFADTILVNNELLLNVVNIEVVP